MKAITTLAAAVIGLFGLAGAPEAAVLTFVTKLSGAAEAPPNASPGTGRATLRIDTGAQTFAIDVDFFDLLSPTAAAHIHGPTAAPGSGTAGVMTQVPSFGGFPLGVTTGSYAQVFDMTDAATWNPAFVTLAGSTVAAASTFVTSAVGGSSYLNIHSTAFPSGEIRGFFTPAPIPLPAGLWLTLTGLGALGVAGARRRA